MISESTWDHFHLKHAHKKLGSPICQQTKDTKSHSCLLLSFPLHLPDPCSSTGSFSLPLLSVTSPWGEVEDLSPLILSQSSSVKFCVPSPFSSKIPLEAQSIITLPGTTLGPCQLKRSPRHFQASKASSPAYASKCVNSHPWRPQERVTSVPLRHGNIQVSWQSKATSVLCPPLGACCPSQASPLGTHRAEQGDHNCTKTPGAAGKDGKMAWAGVTGTLPRAVSICG